MKPGRSICSYTKSVTRLFLLPFLGCIMAMTAKSQVKFGLMGGINESTLLIGNENNYYLTGFEAGIASEINLSRHFYLFSGVYVYNEGRGNI